VRAGLEVGLKKVRLFQQRLEFGADVGGRRLDIRQPRQGVTRLELHLRKTGKEIEARFLQIEALAASHQVERKSEAVAGRRGIEPGGGETLGEPRLKPR